METLETTVRAGALADISQLCRDLEEDTELAARFTADPETVLRERDIDIALPAQSDRRTLGAMLEELDPEVRIACIRAISSFVEKPSMDRPNFPLTFVFVVAIANAAVYANANAAATANTVTSVSGAPRSHADAVDSPSMTARQISLGASYTESAVAMRLSALRLSQARQAALLKRAALDGDEVVSRADDDGSTRRVTRYVFHGDTLEVDSRSDADGIEILDARILA